MKILCDVHISYKLVNFLIIKGIETLHVNQILDKWFSKDQDIALFADAGDYTVVSKDADFKQSHLLQSTPNKLIKINLGNVPNTRLIEIFDQYLADFQIINDQGKCLIEVNYDNISIIQDFKK